MRKPLTSLIVALAAGVLASCDTAPPQQPLYPPQPSAPAQSGQVQQQPQNVEQARAWPPPPSGPSEVIPTVSDEELFATNWVTVLDNSGSMDTENCAERGANRMVVGGRAVHAFAVERPNDLHGLVVFTGNEPWARVAVPLGKNTQGKIRHEVETINANTNTPLGPAIRLAYDELVKQARAQRGYGHYRIVVVTDGDYNVGGNPAPLVRWIVERTPVQIDVVGFCTGSSHKLNIPGYTGYVSIENSGALQKALSAVVQVESDEYSGIGRDK